MTKKNTVNFEQYLTEKRQLEERLNAIRSELNSARLSQYEISKLATAAGDIHRRVESFKYQHGANLGHSDNLKKQLASLEADYKAALDKSRCASAKRKDLEEEKATLERSLSDMRYSFLEGELVNILKTSQSAENKKSELEQLIADHQSKQESARKDLSQAKEALGHLKHKRRDVLAEMATGDKKTDSSLSTVDAEIQKAEADLSFAQKELSNAEDTIHGLQKLLSGQEENLKQQREVAAEAVCHYLVDRANIVGDRYEKLTAQVGQHYSELQAISKLVNEIGGGNFPVQISAFSEHRLYVPAFSIGSISKTIGDSGLLTPEQVDIQTALATEKQTLSEMGFSC